MASLKRTAMFVKSKIDGKEDTSTDGIVELNVTVGYLGADVDKGEIGKLERLMQDYCVAGVVSIERGDLEQHLHFQMVCRARVKSERAFGILCRKYMDWYAKKNMSPAGKVTCKVLTNRLLHTWKGMIGYCLKDSRLTHFEVAMHNISDEEIIVGKTLHSIYGKVDLKSRVLITNKNIGERAYVWYKYKEDRQLTATFLSTLTDMIKSAMFMLAASWIIPHTGLGMEQRRMNSFWKCITDPTNVDRADVAHVFIRKREYVKGRYFDEEVVPPTRSTGEKEYVYDGSPLSADAPNGSGSVSPTSVDRKLPRSLDVPPLSGSLKKQNLTPVVGKTVGVCPKRKIFAETSSSQRQRKTMTFVDPLGDFIPLRDIVVLPTNNFLPTTDALAGNQPRKTPLTKKEFWDDLSNLPLNRASTVVQEDVNVLPKQKEMLEMNKSDTPLQGRQADWLRNVTESDIVVLSSDSEPEDNGSGCWPKGAASVFEDRAISSRYIRGGDNIHIVVKIEPTCDPRRCWDPPSQCRERCI